MTVFLFVILTKCVCICRAGVERSGGFQASPSTHEYSGRSDSFVKSNTLYP